MSPRVKDTRIALIIVPLLLSLACAGCTKPPHTRTTFLRSVDLVAMTNQMAQSFASDELIASRSANDEPWVISIDRIVNHTNQIIPEREKWLYVARLRSELAQSRLAQERELLWVMPPERYAQIAEELDPDAPAAPEDMRRPPTHLLTAEFNVLTNTSGQGRSDAYLASYELIELRTGHIVWEDAFEVKRAAAGRTYD